MSRDLRYYAHILFFATLVLVFVPVFGSLFSQHIADRVREISGVIISAFGMLGTLLGWVKGLEQWAGARAARGDTDGPKPT